ncbi:hypothetical protein D3C81_1144350 [compost metagenome]
MVGIRTSLHLPAPVAPFDRTGFGTAGQHAAVVAHAAQVALVQGMDIHVGRIRLQHRSQHMLGPQHRHQRARAGAVQALRACAKAGQHLPVGVELVLLAGPGQHHGAARQQHRLRGKAGRRRIEEGAAGHGQPAHLRRAVAFEVKGGRAAGRVVAGLRLALEHDHAPRLRQPVSHRRPGNAGADDEVVR